MIMEQHLGVVMANDTDQEKRGGINIRVDTLLTDFEYPDLFYPIFPPNMFKVPENGEVVEVIIIGDIDEDDPSDDGDLGTVEFSDYCFWTGRTFDTVEGIIPPELKVNYPKRAGLFWHKDGTIIFYDSTKNAKELTISLTDKKTVFQLKEDEILIQQDQSSWQMKAGKIVTTVSATEMGAAGASEPILKGDVVWGDFFTPTTGLIAVWTAAATTLGSSPDPTGVKAQAYGTAIVNMLAAFVGNNWRSTKHTVDQ